MSRRKGTPKVEPIKGAYVRRWPYRDGGSGEGEAGAQTQQKTTWQTVKEALLVAVCAFVIVLVTLIFVDDEMRSAFESVIQSLIGTAPGDLHWAFFLFLLCILGIVALALWSGERTSMEIVEPEKESVPASPIQNGKCWWIRLPEGDRPSFVKWQCTNCHIDAFTQGDSPPVECKQDIESQPL